MNRSVNVILRHLPFSPLKNFVTENFFEMTCHIIVAAVKLFSTKLFQEVVETLLVADYPTTVTLNSSIILPRLTYYLIARHESTLSPCQFIE